MDNYERILAKRTFVLNYFSHKLEVVTDAESKISDKEWLKEFRDDISKSCEKQMKEYNEWLNGYTHCYRKELSGYDIDELYLSQQDYWFYQISEI